jgi:hypothetical protein
MTPQGENPNPAPEAHLRLLSRGQRIVLWLVVALGLAGSMAAFIVAIIRWNFAFSHFGPAVVWHWARPALIAGLILFIIAIIVLMFWSFRRDHRVFTSAAGLTYHLGRRRKHYPWESLRDLKISVVRYGPSWGTWGLRTSVVVMTDRDKRLRFRGPMAELDVFTTAVKSYLYPLQLRNYRRALQSQETIHFGPLRCTPEGLMYKRRLYPWDSVIAAKLESGRLMISIRQAKATKKIHITAGRVPNSDLCAQLIESIEY